MLAKESSPATPGPAALGPDCQTGHVPVVFGFRGIGGRDSLCNRALEGYSHRYSQTLYQGRTLDRWPIARIQAGRRGSPRLTCGNFGGRLPADRWSMDTPSPSWSIARLGAHREAHQNSHLLRLASAAGAQGRLSLRKTQAHALGQTGTPGKCPGLPACQTAAQRGSFASGRLRTLVCR